MKPRIFINSLPKSGTHLLSSTLSLFPGLQFQPLPLTRKLQSHPVKHVFFRNSIKVHVGVGQPVAVKRSLLIWVFRRLRNGRFTSGHIPYQPEVLSILDQQNIRTIVILRDPRDVCVSLVYYALREKQHVLHDAYSCIPSMRDRIKTAITGISTVNNQQIHKGIKDKLETMVAWQGRKNVFDTKFEHLIGSRGGGCDQKQKSEISALADYLGVSLNEESVNNISSQTFGSSKTFRRGGTGTWKEYFNDELAALCKKEIGKHLIELNYEANLEW